MADDDEVLYSDDYTRLERFRFRSWTLTDDVSLRWMGGFSWEAAWEAVRPTLLMLAPMLLVLLLLGGAWPLMLLLAAPVTYAGSYLKANSRDPEADLSRTIRKGESVWRGATARQRRLLTKASRREPQELGGEPVEISWKAILFVPPEPVR